MGSDLPTASEPNAFEKLTQEGLALVTACNYAEAQDCFQRALAEQPGNPDAHKNLGLACYMQQNFDEAENHFRESLKLDPTYWKTHANLSLIHQQKHEPVQAIAELETAQRLNPLEPVLCQQIALLYLAQQANGPAELYFLKALALTPNDARLLNQYGGCLLEWGRLLEGLHFLESVFLLPCISLDKSEQMTLHHLLANAYLNMEQQIPDGQARPANLTLKLNEHFEALITLHEQGDWLEQLSEEYLYFSYFQWSKALLSLQQYEKALPALQKTLSLKQNPHDQPYLLYCTAYSACYLKQYAVAEQFILDYFQNPTYDREPALFLLLIVLEEQGTLKQEAALNAQLEAIGTSAQPKNPTELETSFLERLISPAIREKVRLIQTHYADELKNEEVLESDILQNVSDAILLNQTCSALWDLLTEAERAHVFGKSLLQAADLENERQLAMARSLMQQLILSFVPFHLKRRQKALFASNPALEKDKLSQAAPHVTGLARQLLKATSAVPATEIQKSPPVPVTPPPTKGLARLALQNATMADRPVIPPPQGHTTGLARQLLQKADNTNLEKPESPEQSPT